MSRPAPRWTTGFENQYEQADRATAQASKPYTAGTVSSIRALRDLGGNIAWGDDAGIQLKLAGLNSDMAAIVAAQVSSGREFPGYHPAWIDDDGRQHPHGLVTGNAVALVQRAWALEFEPALINDTVQQPAGLAWW